MFASWFCGLRRYSVRRAVVALVATAFVALPQTAEYAAAAADKDYPTRLVRIIVPFPPGGAVDLVIRAVAQELSSKWGTPVIVENRTGAGGTIGTEAVYRAAPDGYTLLATVNQTVTTASYLFKSLPYDPSKLTPITLMVESDNFVLANPEVKAETLRELVDLVKSEPKKWTYGSFGRGSQPQLFFEYLNSKEGLDLLHVAYNGVSPLLIAMITGEVPLTVGSAGVAGEFLRAGKLKALAIAGKKRSAQFPDVPTSEEAGFGYLQSSIWYAVFAPPGTPAGIVNKLGSEIRNILRRPDFNERHLSSKGLDTVASTSEELADIVRNETVTVKDLIEAAKIQPE